MKRTPTGKAIDLVMSELWKKVKDPRTGKLVWPKATELHFNHMVSGKSRPFSIRVKPLKRAISCV